MKVIIAGSRWITGLREVQLAMADAEAMEGIRPTEVVSGMARGVDLVGVMWAKRCNIPVREFHAAWKDKDGMKNLLAGQERNQRMAEYADALVAVWDGVSSGTLDMINRATARGLKIHVRYYDWRKPPGRPLPDPSE